MSIKALKLSNCERLKKNSSGCFDFRAPKLSNRVSFRALKLSKWATEHVCLITFCKAALTGTPHRLDHLTACLIQNKHKGPEMANGAWQ